MGVWDIRVDLPAESRSRAHIGMISGSGAKLAEAESVLAIICNNNC